MLNHAHPELANARCVVFVDDSRTYVDCSDGACALLGYTRAELLRKRIDDISYDIDAVQPLFSEFLKRGALDGEFVLQTSSKSPLFIKYKSFLFSDGCKAATWEPVRDWRQVYVSALAERDPLQLRAKVKAARIAVQHARSLATNPNETRTLDDAAAALDIISGDYWAR